MSKEGYNPTSNYMQRDKPIP